MSTKSTDFPTALKNTLHDVFEATWTDEGLQCEKVFDVETSTDAYEDELQIQGPDSIPLSSEGAVFERVEIENIRSKRFTHVIYKGEIKVTREALDDVKYKQCTNAVKKLAEAGVRTIEQAGAANLYNMFTSELSPDGVSVFNAAHPLNNPLATAPSTTGRNLGTGTLSGPNIGAARILGRKTPDEHGSPTPFQLRQLIVGPDLEDVSEAIKGTSQVLGSNNNDRNIPGSKIDEIVVLDYLAGAPTNPDKLWILRDKKKARNKMFWRVKPERKLVQEEGSGDWLYRLYFRLSFGSSDWRGLFGSDGSGNATALY